MVSSLGVPQKLLPTVPIALRAIGIAYSANRAFPFLGIAPCRQGAMILPNKPGGFTIGVVLSMRFWRA